MSKRSDTTTRPEVTGGVRRRDVLAGVGFFAGIAVAAPAVAELVKGRPSADDAEWREFIAGVSWMHPNGRAAAERARAAGMDLSRLRLVHLHDAHTPEAELPELTFGEVAKGEAVYRVNPVAITELRPVRRGAGPWIVAPAGKAVRS